MTGRRFSNGSKTTKVEYGEHIEAGRLHYWTV